MFNVKQYVFKQIQLFFYLFDHFFLGKNKVCEKMPKKGRLFQMLRSIVIYEHL